MLLEFAGLTGQSPVGRQLPHIMCQRDNEPCITMQQMNDTEKSGDSCHTPSVLYRQTRPQYGNQRESESVLQHRDNSHNRPIFSIFLRNYAALVE